MKTLFKGLEINKNDNELTSAGKGMIEGTLAAGLLWLTLGTGLIVAGKIQQELEKKKVETTEEAVGE